eukprot:jgi/Botrbrau1/16362/Bobra.0372s0001.2
MKDWQASLVLSCHVLSIQRFAWLVLVITIQGAATSETNTKAIASTNPTSISYEKIRLALEKAWWKAPDFSHLTGLRTVSVRGVLSKEKLENLFPTGRTLIGPAMLLTARIYGRSINNALKSSVAAAAGQIFKAQFERLCSAEFPRLGSSVSLPAEMKRVKIGLQDLLLTLPGPPSPHCSTTFVEADFCSCNIWAEIWFNRDTMSAVLEFTGAKWLAAYKRWMHATMAELGFPEG